MPGQANMVSVTTAPEIRAAKLTKNRVNTGMAAFLKACFQTTIRVGSPLARTSLM